MDTSPREKVYPVHKIALVLDALAAEGMPTEDALKQIRLSKDAIASSTTRVSLNQVIDCYNYAASRVRDPSFAYRAGLRAHLSAYGMYGFAILSSMNYRQTMQFAVNYHLLATPLTIMQFSESDGCGIWHLNPISNTRIDSRLYKFIVEMQFGIILSLHRDVMGRRFQHENFRSPIRKRTMQTSIEPCSVRLSRSVNLPIDCCSTQVGSTAPRGSAMRLRTRPCWVFATDKLRSFSFVEASPGKSGKISC